MRKRKREKGDDLLFQARLSAKKPQEREAIRVFDELNEDMTVRQILTLALRSLPKVDPEVMEFETEEDNIIGMLSSIFSEIRQQGDVLHQMIMFLRSSDPDAFRNLANMENDDEAYEYGAEIIQNMLNRASPTFRQMRGESTTP